MQTHLQSSVAPLSSVPNMGPFLAYIQEGLLKHTVSTLPLLTKIAQYYILQPSKRLRPCLVLLMCQASNGAHLFKDFGKDVDAVRNEDATPPKLTKGTVKEIQSTNILPSQLRLAEVIEMIHVGTLLHDDVIDEAETRRGAPSVPVQFGNHYAVLAGDFLLGRSMALVASLSCPEAMSIVSESLCALAEGELLQAGEVTLNMTAEAAYFPTIAPPPVKDDIMITLWNQYLHKTYMKTASLLSNALKCGVVLGGTPVGHPLRDIASCYGACFGMAFQLIDDILDFEGDPKKMGKPVNADLTLGLATAPVFFALQEDESMRALILRRFQQPGDVEKASQARDAISVLPDSEAKRALEDLTYAILKRMA